MTRQASTSDHAEPADARRRAGVGIRVALRDQCRDLVRADRWYEAYEQFVGFDTGPARSRGGRPRVGTASSMTSAPVGTCGT